MQVRDPINTPSLSGWIIAAGLGTVGAAVSWVLLGIGANGSVFIGSVVALIVGVIIGLPSSSVPKGRAEPALAFDAPVSPAPAQTAPDAGLAPASATTRTPAAPPVAPAASASPVAAAAPLGDPAPASAFAPAQAAEPAEKPRTLAGARDGRPDDLKLIRGIGPKMEAMLHRLGFFHYDQIAGWTQAELAWVDDNLEGFKGRASRDEWVTQARTLAAGGTVAFSAHGK